MNFAESWSYETYICIYSSRTSKGNCTGCRIRSHWLSPIYNFIFIIKYIVTKWWQSPFSMKKSADTIMWCLLKRFKSFAKSLTCKIVKKSKADRWNFLLLTSQIMLGKNGEQVQLTWHILGTMFVISEFNHHVCCLW